MSHPRIAAAFENVQLGRIGVFWAWGINRIDTSGGPRVFGDLRFYQWNIGRAKDSRPRSHLAQLAGYRIPSEVRKFFICNFAVCVCLVIFD